MKQTKEYQGYDSWEKFLNKYEKANFSNPKIRKNFRNDFYEVSKLMWKAWIENMDADDLAEQLSNMWCSGIEPSKNMEENYQNACSYCFYASDRMNINRWMRIRILLNYDVE